MQSLVEETKVIEVLPPASRSSAATGDWISMENYDKVSFIIQTGAVGTGGDIKILEATSASGSSSAQVDISNYYKRSSADTYTKASADSVSSNGGITVADADDSTTWVVEVNGASLSATKPWVTVQMPGAFATALTSVVAIAHKARYASQAPPTALS